MKELLSGKKTYIVAILAGVIVALQSLDMIDQGQAEAIYGMLGAMGLVTLRAGIAKAAPVILAVVGLGLMPFVVGCQGISGPWGGVKIDGTSVEYRSPSIPSLVCRWGWSATIYEATGLQCPEDETPAEPASEAL